MKINSNEEHLQPVFSLTSCSNLFAKYGLNCSIWAGDLAPEIHRCSVRFRYASELVHLEAILQASKAHGRIERAEMTVNNKRLILTVLLDAWAESLLLTLRWGKSCFKSSDATSSSVQKPSTHTHRLSKVVFDPLTLQSAKTHHQLHLSRTVQPWASPKRSLPQTHMANNLP